MILPKSSVLTHYVQSRRRCHITGAPSAPPSRNGRRRLLPTGAAAIGQLRSATTDYAWSMRVAHHRIRQVVTGPPNMRTRTRQKKHPALLHVSTPKISKWKQFHKVSILCDPCRCPEPAGSRQPAPPGINSQVSCGAGFRFSLKSARGLHGDATDCGWDLAG